MKIKPMIQLFSLEKLAVIRKNWEYLILVATQGNKR